MGGVYSNLHTYTPVRGRIKEARWVLKKISPGVIKNNTQWFWCQTISIHQSFLYFSNAFRLPLLHEQNIVMYRLSGIVLVDTGYRSSEQCSR